METLSKLQAEIDGHTKAVSESHQESSKKVAEHIEEQKRMAEKIKSKAEADKCEIQLQLLK